MLLESPSSSSNNDAAADEIEEASQKLYQVIDQETPLESNAMGDASKALRVLIGALQTTTTTTTMNNNKRVVSSDSQCIIIGGSLKQSLVGNARTLPSSVSLPFCWKRAELSPLVAPLSGLSTLQDVASTTLLLAKEFTSLVDAGLLHRFPSIFP